MSKIAIVGAGKLGTALTKLIITSTDFDVALIDTREEQLLRAVERCNAIQRPEQRLIFNPTPPIQTFLSHNADQLEATLRAFGADVIVCAAPAVVALETAFIANKLSAHYLDFNDDESVAASIRELSVARRTFVPSTGLAPGLVSYIGFGLFELLDDEPSSLQLRAGVLPQVAFGPSYYALTNNAEDLARTFVGQTLTKRDGVIEAQFALDGYETLTLNGVAYEAFYTVGGLGDVHAYDSIPTVSFKTLRSVGHLAFLEKKFASVGNNFDDAVALLKRTFTTTQDDYVVLIAHATDVAGHSASSGLIFYPSLELDLTACEVCAAGTALGIIELMLDDALDKGVLGAEQISTDDLFKTGGLTFVFNQCQ